MFATPTHAGAQNAVEIIVNFASHSIFELLLEPFEQFALICYRGTSYLYQKLIEVWTLECDVGSTLVTDRANGFQVIGIVGAAQAFVDHMADMEPRFASCVKWMRLTCNRATHLASEAIAV